MPYDKDTPASINETFSISQPKITANFQAIKTLIDQDHETFSAPNDDGKHKQVTMPAQTTVSTTLNSEIAMYCKNNAAGDPALWIKVADVDAAADGTDITTYENDASNQGYTFLPCGLLLCWGDKVLGVNDLSLSVAFKHNFNAAGPFQVTNSISGAANGKADVSNVAVATTYTFSNVTFTRDRAENIMTMRYFAIGIGA